MNISQQKNKKKGNIMQAAYDCFVEHGISKTSIDEIVKRANVAKGTFYLYFKDKSDLSEQIFVKLSRKIIVQAYAKVRQENLTEYLDIVIGFIDNIIEYMKQNKLVLKLMERNFSWPLLENELSVRKEDEELSEIRDFLMHNPHRPKVDEHGAFLHLFTIISLCGSVGYRSIIKGQPADIDEMKPVLYDMIRRILA